MGQKFVCEETYSKGVAMGLNIPYSSQERPLEWNNHNNPQGAMAQATIVITTECTLQLHPVLFTQMGVSQSSK